jgi:translation initiation factor IF-3
MAGVISTQDALRMAQDRGLDLIEVAPDAKPPTCKIMDYGKYKYETKKKATESRKKQTVVSIKEIQLRPRTEEHDMNVKLKHARKFLMSGDKTRVNLRFRGREMAHQEIGMDVLKKVIEELKDVSVVEVPPKLEGRQLFVLLAPDPARLKEIQKAKKEAVEGAKKAEKAEEKQASTPAE